MRDMTPATGTGPQPAFGRKTGEPVALHRRRTTRSWSYLYGDTDYAGEARAKGTLPPLGEVGPGMLKAPVWTWEVPLYFWTGGIASGSAFVALACDLAGDHRSARIARLVSLGALAPSPPLLILDLGRPERFYNMLRVFKTRSPMSMGAWALTLFGNLIAGAVGADLLGRERTARALGGATAIVGGYLGSYTGVLLASTAVPLWARSRLFLGPIFVCTATATGAAATHLVLVGADPSRRAGRCATSRRARWRRRWCSRWSTSAGWARTPSRCTAAEDAAGPSGWSTRASACSSSRRPRVASAAVPAGGPVVPLRVGRGRAGIGARRPRRGRDGARAALKNRRAGRFTRSCV